jgi:ribose-phosphate pyrophosphokinase
MVPVVRSAAQNCARWVALPSARRAAAGSNFEPVGSARAHESEVMHLIGDVKGRNCIIVDDLIDTAGTLCNAARAVMDNGAKSVVACATHGVLSGPAVQRIEDSPLSEVVVSNSVPLSERAKACNKIRTVSLARLLGEAIRRIHNSDSVSSLFV